MKISNVVLLIVERFEKLYFFVLKISNLNIHRENVRTNIRLVIYY